MTTAQRPKFVAGVVCPQCRELDRIVVEEVDGERRQRCVSCGFIKADVGRAAKPGTSSSSNPGPHSSSRPQPKVGRDRQASWVPASGPGQIKGRLERSVSPTEAKPIEIIDPSKG